MKKSLNEQLLNPDKSYRPIPFWSWNEKLSCEETVWQIDEMSRKGIGGYFMHARGGLQTEYMGKEWMDNIKAGISEGQKKGMGAWGYDENGWPSGFGDGKVNGLGVPYQQKYLRFDYSGEKAGDDNTIIVKDLDGRKGYFYYETNPFYVDVLDPKVTAKFIETVHERYKAELGDSFRSLTGFFTDEPQISRNGIPWSFILEEEYQKRYNESLIESIEDLFIRTETASRTRVRFWSLVRDLFAENFMKQIYDWCNANGVLLTGHMVLEETLLSQLTSNSSCMPNYEYMHIPGMDWLTRNYPKNTTSLQLSSVGHQLGKKQMISETFALCGWNVSFEELKWLYEAQMVRGINLMCQHLEGYTLRGIRKRDYPASLFYQQPWWDDYELFNDYLTRIGVLLTEGTVDYKVLMLHPQSSAWIVFDNSKNEGLNALEEDWSMLMGRLENNQVNFHLGDEKIIERHGKVSGSKFIVGSQEYEVVVVPPVSNLSARNFELLRLFKQNGGVILFSEKTPEMIDGVYSQMLIDFVKTCPALALADIAAKLRESYCDIKIRPVLDTDPEVDMVFVTTRHFEPEGFDMVYIVNSDKTGKNLSLTLPYAEVALFDPSDGEVYEIPYARTGDCCVVEYKFEALGSLVLFGAEENKIRFKKDGKSGAFSRKEKKPLNFGPGEEWNIEQMDPNAVTLDYCDCYFDGDCIGRGIPVNNIQQIACEMKKPVEVKLVYKFKVNSLDIGPVSLVIETPEKFEILLNNTPVKKEVTGYYWDKSFKTIPLAEGLVLGENEIVCKTIFKQRPEVYESISKSLVFESEKNKLTYDDEIEAVYLIGDFGVETPGEFTMLTGQAVRYSGEFIITKRPGRVFLGSIVTQGFPFFSGSISLSQTFNLAEDELENRVLRFGHRCCNNARVYVNGKDAGNIIWAPYEVPLDGLLHEGKNTIEILFIGTLRNLLGPHHLSEGESHVVGPFSFFRESKLWLGGGWRHGGTWTDSYCFVDFVGPLESEDSF